MDLNSSIQKLNITTKEHLDALEKNTSEIKSQTPFSEVLSTFGMSLLNPTMWWKIMTGPLGKIAGMYGLYKLADAGVQWVKPKLTTLGATTIPGTNDKTIGSVFKSGKSVLTQYIVDPLISGMKTVFKWVLGDEWFNRIGGYLSTIKTYTVDVAHALFGDPSQKQEARSKLGKIIHDKVYQAVSALIPIILKGIMVYRGTKLLMNPKQLLENFRTLGFGKVAGIFSRSEDKKILDAITQQKFEQAMIATKGSTIAANNIVRQGNKAYEYTPRKGILGALGLKKKTLVERDIKNSYVPTQKDFLENQGYTFDTKTLKDGRTITTGVYKNGKKLDLLHNQADMNEYRIDTGRFKNATRKFSQTGLGSRLFAAKEAVQGTKLYGWISKPFKFLGSKLGWVSKVFTFLGDKVGWLIKPLKLIGPLFSALVGPLGGILAAFSALSFYANTIAKFGKKQGDGSITGGIGKFIGNFLSNAIGQVGDVIKSGISLLPDILGGFFNGIWRFLKREGPALGRTIFIDLPIKIGEVFWEGIKWLAAQIWKPFQWLGHYISKIIPGWSYTPDWMQTSGYYLSKEFDIDKETKYGAKQDNMAYLAHTKHYGDISNTFEEITNQFKNKDKNLEEGNFSKTLLARTLQNIKDNSEDDVDIYRGAKSLYGMFEKAYLSKDEKLWKEAKEQFEKLRSQEYSVSGDSIDANLARAGLSIEYLKQFKTKEEALDKYLEVVNGDKIYKAIQKPLSDALNKEAEERRKQREAENQRLVAEEVEKMKTEKSETSGSLGQLAQWFKSGAAQKFIKDSITSLGEKIKAGWEFLKNQDYKKMFGSAMEVFGGVSGSIMSTIFGDDKTNAWLDNALKYAESNNLTYAKKFLSGAKNSLKDNVAKTAVNTERTANALEKMVNGQVSPNNGFSGVNSKGFDFGRHLLNAEGSRLGDNGTSRFGMWYWNLKSYAKDSSIDMSDSFRKKLLSSNMDELKSIMQDDKNLSELARIGKSVLYRRYSSNNTIGSYTQFPHPVDYLIMDHAYNAGSGGANRVIKIAAEMFGYKPTGTKDAFNFLKTKMGDPITLGAIVASARLEHYKRIVANNHSKGKYLKGWYNRVTNLAKQFGYTRNGDVFTHNGQAIAQEKTSGAKSPVPVPPPSKTTAQKAKDQTPQVDSKAKENNKGNQKVTVKDPEKINKLQDARGKFREKILADRYKNKNANSGTQGQNAGAKSSDINPDQPVVNTDIANKLQIPKFEDSPKGKFEYATWILKTMREKKIKELKIDSASMFQQYLADRHTRSSKINNFFISKKVDKLFSSSWGKSLSDMNSEALNKNREEFWTNHFKKEGKLSDFDIIDTFKFLNQVQGFELYDLNKVKSILGIKEFKFDKEQFKTGMSSIGQAFKAGINKQREKVRSSAIDDVSNIFNSEKFMTNFMMDGKFNPDGEYGSNYMKYSDIFDKLNAKKLTAEKAKSLLTTKELSDSQKGDLKEYISILTQLLSTFTETYGKNDDRTVQLTNVITQLQNRQNSTNITQQGSPFMNASRNVGRQFKDRAMKK